MKKDLKVSQDTQQDAFSQEVEEKPYYLTKEEVEAMRKDIEDSIKHMEDMWDEIMADSGKQLSLNFSDDNET